MTTCLRSLALLGVAVALLACEGSGTRDAPSAPAEERAGYDVETFVMGADLSYVNQILDHGGVYRDSTGAEVNPYALFADRGANVVRLRLWHNPQWVRDSVYTDADVPLYSGLSDVEESIRRAKAEGLAVALDFHYSDFWADPSTQKVPAAWRDIRDLGVLRDSVYTYTKRVLERLDRQGLMPEMVQVGNETNCGLMYTDAPDGFPPLNGCGGHWDNLGAVLGSGIRAVRTVASSSDVDTQIILHIAQPENVSWWFDRVTTEGGVSDFDVVGVSYYAPYSEVPIDEISTYVDSFRTAYDKKVMIVETAYAWTMESADGYSNIFGEQSRVPGYPNTPQGQKKYLVDLTQEVIDGGGDGVMYWEPAWISSNMKDPWGQGSSWENNAFFDFQGRPLPAFDFFTHPYAFPESDPDPAPASN